MGKKSKNKETIHYDRLLKAKVRMTGQFYPKPPATIEEDSFGIITASVLDVQPDSCQPEIHPRFQTITIKGNRLPQLQIGKEYIVHAYETSSDYGISYTVLMMT